MNWTQSTDSMCNNSSSVNISNISSIAATSRPLGPSLTECNSIDSHLKVDSIMTWEEAECGSTEADHYDSVFNSMEETNSSVNFNSRDMDHLKHLDDTDGSLMARGCSCIDESNKMDCSECSSHMKVPSRQEKMTDDTPQMHRTDESVMNSYAAKNLQALRLGSYNSEDSDSDSVVKDDTKSNKFTPVSRHQPRKLVKSSSFTYPSDDESDSQSEFHSRIKLCRKRSFCDVEQSPIRRSFSAGTGLTQEFKALHFNGGEPASKRSHSFPRTRIRFNSGQDTWQGDSSKPCTQGDSEPNAYLSKIVTDCKLISNPDNLTTLSADEHRVNEGYSASDNSTSESDMLAQQEKSVVDSQTMSAACKMNKPLVMDNIANDSKSLDKCDKNNENVCQNLMTADTSHSMEPIVQGFKGVAGSLDKRLAHLRRPMVSSVRSEGECGLQSPNLSVIVDIDEKKKKMRSQSKEDLSLFVSHDYDSTDHHRTR